MRESRFIINLEKSFLRTQQEAIETCMNHQLRRQ